MRVDFPKKSNVLVQRQKCGISNDVFFLGRSGTAEIQVTVYCAKLRSFKSQIVLCAKTELLNFGTSIFLVRKRNCGTSSHRIFFVRRRNCET